MKSDEHWLAISKQMALEMMKLPDVFSLKQVVDNKFALKLFRSIQTDALKWAAEQITTDGNPDVAREKIMRKINDVAAMPNASS